MKRVLEKLKFRRNIKLLLLGTITLTFVSQSRKDNLVGKWGYKITNFDSKTNFLDYLELYPDGKGIHSLIIKQDSVWKHLEPFKSTITNWKIVKDSILIVNYQTIEDISMSDNWIIKKISKNTFIASTYYKDIKNRTILFQKFENVIE